MLGPPGSRLRHVTHRRCPDAAAGLLLAIGSAQAADAITFVRMVRDHGIAPERNPLVAQLAMGGDVALLVLLKALLVVGVVCVVAVVARRWLAWGVALAAFAVAAGLVGAFSNVAVIAG